MRILTTLFFLMAFVIPVQAEHPASSLYFCTTMDAAMETVRFRKARDTDTLIDKALYDENFKCWFRNTLATFTPVELVHQYRAYDVNHGVVRAIAPDGVEVFLFGTMQFINRLMHQEGA